MSKLICPVCGSASIPIVYGLPGSELFERADRGEVSLGGCIVWDEQPNAQCTSVDCRARFDSKSSAVATASPFD